MKGSTFNVFTSNHPDAVVIATGSTGARTRFCRMGIANNSETIKREYIVPGLFGDSWETFKKDVAYVAFLVRKRFS